MAEVGVGGVVDGVEVEGGLEIFGVGKSVEGGLGGRDGGGGVGVSAAVSAVPIGRPRHGAGEGGFAEKAVTDWQRSERGGGCGGVHEPKSILVCLDREMETSRICKR